MEGKEFKNGGVLESILGAFGIGDDIKNSILFGIESDRFNKNMTDNTKEKIAILNNNVYSFRNILITLVGFSLTIIGVSLSFLFKENNNLPLLILGLIFLVISVMCSILYILSIYHFENNKIVEQIKFNQKFKTDFLEIINDSYQKENFDSFVKKKIDFLKIKQEEEQKLNSSKNKYALMIKNRDFTPHLNIFLLDRKSVV